jgi:glycosyltransferase involved in cell wall biosynthesis
MHILINGMFWSKPNTGSGQYLHGLLRWLPRVAPHHRYTLLLPTAEAVAPPALSGIDTLTLRTPFDRRSRNLAKLAFEQIILPRAAALLAHGNARLLVPYAAPPLQSALPVVTTVHDIIWWLLPEYRGNPLQRLYFRLVVAGIRHSATVLTDSQHSRQDIIENLGLPTARVHSIALAADERYAPGDPAAARAEVAARYGLHAPFVYYVGGLDVRKNVPLLLRAFAHLQFTRPQPARLAIAGKTPAGKPRLFPDLDALIAELKLQQHVSRIEVPFEAGPLLYRAATIFAFPSYYEGFGLGPLEAMACGTPVLCSNSSSLPEVVADAAITRAPDDIAGWADALAELLRNPALRDDLHARGLQRAAQFSWQRVAEETIDVLAQPCRISRPGGLN